MYDIVVRNASNNSLVTNGITVLTYISRYADPANVIDNDYVIPRNGDTRGLLIMQIVLLLFQEQIANYH